MNFAKLPEPPYWAVIFSSQLSEDESGYEAAAERMMTLARGRDGFLGAESARDAGGFGITVCYQRDLDAIAAWKRDVEHLAAQARGKAEWYAGFRLRVARVERANGGETG